MLPKRQKGYVLFRLQINKGKPDTQGQAEQVERGVKRKVKGERAD
jgi:hypothetical protein